MVQHPEPCRLPFDLSLKQSSNEEQFFDIATKANRESFRQHVTFANDTQDVTLFQEILFLASCALANVRTLRGFASIASLPEICKH